MRVVIRLAAIITLLSVVSCQVERGIIFKTDTFQVEINEKGFITGFIDRNTSEDYLPEGNMGPLIAIVDEGQLKMPVSCQPVDESEYRLTYDQSNVQIAIIVEEKKTHITFRIKETENVELLEAILWGPYTTVIDETVGETVGVVRNKEFAIGIQSLNPKTTGGKLENSEGAIPGWGTTAEATSFGSVLQAFAIDRRKDRTMSTWDGWIDRFPGRPMIPMNEEEGSVKGSAIALFGCIPDNVLETLGEIELTEGLPHPEVSGTWIKKSQETGRAYVISPFTEENVDRMLDFVEQTGLRSLYHEGPFETWGHFELNEMMFPNGRAGLKKCVEKAKERGLNLGVHTLTNFITTNDPFVTPIPDSRLAITGMARLMRDISAGDSKIEISSKDLVTNQKNSSLNTIKIGEELIRYGSVSDETPYILYDCQRGVFGTKASAHAQNDSVVKLLDHPYRVFFPNWEMQKEMIENMAMFFNETGVNHMDFDGHEGCYSTRQGDYSMDYFATEFQKLVDHVVINGSSRFKHFYWHTNHYINWGEPWYGGFRESQEDRRIKIQPYLERNYMPNMLGWFLIRSSTTPAEMEWMMARASGYSAGFAMVLRLDELDQNPFTKELLHLIKIWEEARLAGVFSDEQRERLKDGNNEFHLEKVDEETLVLYPYVTHMFEYEKKILQPGEPTASEWSFENNHIEQTIQFRITVKGEEGNITKPELEYDNFFTFALPKEITAGYSIVCDGTDKLRIYDERGRFTKEFNMGTKPPLLRTGAHTFRFGCDFSENDNLKISVILKLQGKEERLVMK